MKKLELSQMEDVEGGSFWGALACIAGGAAVGMVLTPAVGFTVGFMCQALVNPKEAH